MLENLIALALIRKCGSKKSVYYYTNGVEVDLYIPEAETAIQVSYTIKNSTETFDREIKALNKISERIAVKRKLIITFDREKSGRICNPYSRVNFSCIKTIRILNIY